MMSPNITEISQDDDTNILNFTLKNINVSLANAIRRVIISEIPTIVFKTSPYEKNKVDIIINTSRFNNEIIKQRLSCIPINIKDIDFPYSDYQIELDVKNDTDNIIYVTTNDFKIKNKTNNTYLTDSQKQEVFPPNKITNDYILLARLRPKITQEIPGEHLKFIAELDIGTAKEDGAYNVASICYYTNTMDKIKINQIWNEKEKELKSKGIEESEIVSIKKDWLLLDAKRIFIDNSYDFSIKTVGNYSNLQIVNKACNIILDKLTKFKKEIETDEELIEKSNVIVNNCFDIKLINEDYTLGKIIEYMLYYSHYDFKEKNDISDRKITFCGFKKPHPHINEAIIRIAFKDDIEKQLVIPYISNAIENLKKIYNKILIDFPEN